MVTASKNPFLPQNGVTENAHVMFFGKTGREETKPYKLARRSTDTRGKTARRSPSAGQRPLLLPALGHAGDRDTRHTPPPPASRRLGEEDQGAGFPDRMKKWHETRNGGQTDQTSTLF